MADKNLKQPGISGPVVRCTRYSPPASCQAGANRKGIPPGLLLTMLLTLSSCSLKDPMLDVLQGNSRYSMGDYAGATVNYMQALDKQKNREWIYYNLGNTYSALGEIEPGLAQYQRALGEQDPELLFRVNFNLGNIYYELGEYAKAVNFYKESLRAKPGSMDAKFNLELAVKKYIDNLTAAAEYTQTNSGRNNSLPEEMLEILDTTRRQEEAIWKKLTEKQPAPQLDDW